MLKALIEEEQLRESVMKEKYWKMWAMLGHCYGKLVKSWKIQEHTIKDIENNYTSAVINDFNMLLMLLNNINLMFFNPFQEPFAGTHSALFVGIQTPLYYDIEGTD